MGGDLRTVTSYLTQALPWWSGGDSHVTLGRLFSVLDFSFPGDGGRGGGKGQSRGELGSSEETSGGQPFGWGVPARGPVPSPASEQRFCSSEQLA